MKEEKEKFSAIVLAAGRGRRMGTDTPKQYLPLCGKPVLYYSLKAFEESRVNEIVLVTAPGDEAYVRDEIVRPYGFTKVRAIVSGGKERSDSVQSGVRKASGDYVLIHDSARAFLTPDLIRRMEEAVVRYGAAVAAVPEKNTVKLSDQEGFVRSTPDRSLLWEVQTPQAFERKLLLDSFDALSPEDHARITDDAMVVELAGERASEGRKEGAPADGGKGFPRVKLVMGDYDNIKITTPGDLDLGKEILRRREVE